MFWYALGSVSTIPKACFSRLMQQLNQTSTGARCLSVLIAKSCFISFWFLAMKPIISVFSFSHWGSTQSTNKRAKKVACFYFTILRTYILYLLFALIFTIKYNLSCLSHINKNHLLVSKICELPDLFLSLKRLKESKEHYLRRVFHISFFWLLAVPPVHHVSSLAMYTFLLPLVLISSGNLFA